MHVNSADEHGRALAAFMGLADVLDSTASILDVGAGTGRAVVKFKARWPDAKVIGVEPVEALRRVGYENGLSESELIDGDALQLPFDDNSFDYVVETRVLQHNSRPSLAVSEMVRVAKKGVMISDSNNVGQGGLLARFAKYMVKVAGAWSMLVCLQTRGRMYNVSEGDGVYYSFSAFGCVKDVSTKFPVINYLNTGRIGNSNLYRSSTHVMILAVKQ